MSDDQTMKVHKGWTADKTILKEAKEMGYKGAPRKRNKIYFATMRIMKNHLGHRVRKYDP